VAARLALTQPTWLCQTLPRRGVVAGLYAPEATAPGGVIELETPRLFATGMAPPSGPCVDAAVQIPADLQPLLLISAARATAGTPSPWQPVLPLYPTSPVDG